MAYFPATLILSSLPQNFGTISRETPRPFPSTSLPGVLHLRGNRCASLTPVSGLRLGTDPVEEAILLGLDGAGEDAPMVKKSDPQVYGMWFGPRLGRRERRSADELLDDAGDSRVEEVLQLLKETPWVLVPLKGTVSQPWKGISVGRS
jgi:hypothetical protein